nr:diacylglycerol kinase family protein [Pedobacter sp. ASV19]
MSKFIQGFGFAGKGLYYTFKTQINFRFHCGAALAVVICGWYFNLNQTEWLWILLSIAMVLVLELVNTAIEALVDLVSPDYHQKAGIAKDTAAAAVLIAALLAALIGLIIFIPKII